MSLMPLERAVVLDASVRRWVDAGMDAGSAVRMVVAENDVDVAEVIGAVIDVSRVLPPPPGGRRTKLSLDALAWQYVQPRPDRKESAASVGGGLA